MRLTFTLRDPRNSKPQPIIALVFWHRDGVRLRWKVSTGLRVTPKRWDSRRKRAKRGTVEEAIVARTLERIERDVYRTFDDFADPPTLDAVKDRYAVLTGSRPDVAGERDVLADYTAFISETTTFTAGTKRNHTSALNHLRRFGEAYGLTLMYDDFGVLLWEKLAGYLLRVAGLLSPSGWAILKSVKAFLAAAHRKGWHSNRSFELVTRSRLVPRADTAEKPYLTEDEVDRVIAVELPDRLARVRDLFVFACYTGIRFGDLQALRPEHLQGDVLRFTTGKNRKFVAVPLLPEAAAIWERYGGTLPTISNQKANAYLQETLLVAGIDGPVVTVGFRGIERVEATVPKWKAIGFHGSKRTFVTLARQRGITVEAIRTATGNSLATLERYRLGTEEDAVLEIVEKWK